MRFVKKLLIAATLSTLAMPILADTDIVGAYKCSGQDLDKSKYEMNLNIVKTGDTYRFNWEATGAKPYSGTGLLSKHVNDVVGVEFWNPANPDNSGVIIYQIQPDGSLAGSWAVADQPAVGLETCKKQ